MFEKCEQATHNPDSLLHNHSSKSYNDFIPYNQHANSNNNNYYNRNGNNQDMSTNQINDMKSFDQELKYFLNENQHVILNESQGDKNSTLDEMVIIIYMMIKHQNEHFIAYHTHFIKGETEFCLKI
jgi:hypothetical protein